MMKNFIVEVYDFTFYSGVFLIAMFCELIAELYR